MTPGTRLSPVLRWNIIRLDDGARKTFLWELRFEWLLSVYDHVKRPTLLSSGEQRAQAMCPHHRRYPHPE